MRFCFLRLPFPIAATISDVQPPIFTDRKDPGGPLQHLGSLLAMLQVSIALGAAFSSRVTASPGRELRVLRRPVLERGRAPSDP